MTKPIAVRSTRRRLVAAAALIAAAHKPALADPKMEIRVRHVVLLGDSIFDNAAYVAGGPDVVHQLRERLPSGWRATLAAVDGSVTASVALQLQQLPPDASHLIVSVGRVHRNLRFMRRSSLNPPYELARPLAGFAGGESLI